MKSFKVVSLVLLLTSVGLVATGAAFAQAGSPPDLNGPPEGAQFRELELQRLKLKEQMEIREKEALRIREGIPDVPVVERCPSGYHPRQTKCTESERKRGCKDLTMPAGLNCISD